jgi:hypothetical protein
MFYRIAAAWTVLTVLAMGFTAPSPPRSGSVEAALVGALGATASAAPFSARRPRARVAGTDGIPDRSSPLGLHGMLGLLPRVRSLAPDSSGQRLALVSPVLPGWQAAATPRTSRGPPAFAAL